MDGWMDGWIDRQTDRHREREREKERERDRQTDRQTDRQIKSYSGRTVTLGVMIYIVKSKILVRGSKFDIMCALCIHK